jgi:hypothetical protein
MSVPGRSRRKGLGPARAFSYRGLRIVPAFDDARSREIEEAMLAVASRLGIV